MKAYTDIEQSKKLAEILPLESADMFWANAPITVPCIKDGNPMGVNIPCWSLSALLELMPKPLLGQHLESGYWECTTWEDFNVVKEVHGQDNPLDAAFEMILKLKEEGLL